MKVWKGFMSLLIVLIILLGVVVPSAMASNTDLKEINKIKEKNEEINKNIKRIRRHVMRELPNDLSKIRGKPIGEDIKMLDIMNPKSPLYFRNPKSPYYHWGIPLRNGSFYIPYLDKIVKFQKKTCVSQIGISSKYKSESKGKEKEEATIKEKKAGSACINILSSLPKQTPNPGEGFGTYIKEEYWESIEAIYALHEVRTELEVPVGSTLYAPALNAPNHSPYEVVTAYWKAEGMSQTAKALGIWNHSKGFWDTLIPINSDFLNKYVREYPEGKFYEVLIKHEPPYWKVYLYNYAENDWDEICSTQAIITNSDAYEIWEYYFSTCPESLPDIEAMDLRIYISGSWTLVTETYGWKYDSCVSCQYERYFVEKYYHWNVTGLPSGILVAFEQGYLSGTGATYVFSVSGDTKYTVVLAGNENADFDLYAKWGSPPTTTDYDARGYSATSLEYFTTSGSGTLYIMIRSYSGSGYWKCWVLTRGPTEDSGRKTGYLSNSGDEDAYSIVGGGHGYAFISGPDTADFDLYVKWNSVPTTTDYDDRGYSVYSQEIAHAKGTGTFYWKIRSYSGSSEYATVALIF